MPRTTSGRSSQRRSRGSPAKRRNASGFTRSKPHGRDAHVNSKKSPATPSKLTDLNAILGRMSDALALVDTVAFAFIGAEEGAGEHERPGLKRVAPPIIALSMVALMLSNVYEEWDLALIELEKTNDL